jgi:hypothetical protein
MDTKVRGNGISGLNLKLKSPKISEENENTENNKLNTNLITKSEEFKTRKVNKFI